MSMIDWQILIVERFRSEYICDGVCCILSQAVLDCYYLLRYNVNVERLNSRPQGFLTTNKIVNTARNSVLRYYIKV